MTIILVVVLEPRETVRSSQRTATPNFDAHKQGNIEPSEQRVDNFRKSWRYGTSINQHFFERCTSLVSVWRITSSRLKER